MGRKNVKEIDDMTWSEARAAVKRKGYSGSWIANCTLKGLKDLLNGDITEEQARAGITRPLTGAALAASIKQHEADVEKVKFANERIAEIKHLDGRVPTSLPNDPFVLQIMLRELVAFFLRQRDSARDERDTERQQNWKKGAENNERISQLEREKSTLIGAFKLVLASK